MRFIYTCNECNSFIGEIELENWDESMLGFDTLTFEEKNELLHLDREQQIGMVKAICDACYRKKIATSSLSYEVDSSGMH